MAGVLLTGQHRLQEQKQDCQSTTGNILPYSTGSTRRGHGCQAGSLLWQWSEAYCKPAQELTDWGLQGEDLQQWLDRMSQQLVATQAELDQVICSCSSSNEDCTCTCCPQPVLVTGHGAAAHKACEAQRQDSGRPGGAARGVRKPELQHRRLCRAREPGPEQQHAEHQCRCRRSASTSLNCLSVTRNPWC